MNQSRGVLLLFSLVTISLIAFFALDFRPGGLFNRHEWLDDEMRKRPVAKAAVTIDSAHGPNQFAAEFDLEITKQQDSVALARMDPKTYSFMEIETPDGRCMDIDICLKHGELRFLPCEGKK